MSNTIITIQGVPPQWDEAEYELRVKGWINVYHSTTQSMTYVTAPLPHDFLELVAAKTAEGYSVSRIQRVSFDPLNHSCWMIKPVELQQTDIADIRTKVKAEYVEHLQAEHARYQELLRQQLIQAAKAKELKKAEDAEAKRLASIDAEVAATFTKLVIPD